MRAHVQFFLPLPQIILAFTINVKENHGDKNREHALGIFRNQDRCKSNFLSLHNVGLAKCGERTLLNQRF